jgi:hypothetical protein
MTDEDGELQAMQNLVTALKDLGAEAQGRVIEWAAKRFNVTLTRGDAASHQGPNRTGDNGQEFSEFVDLLHAANQENDIDRVLVAGYWFQVLKGNASFTGQQINDALKDTGNGVSNITKALTRLQEREPAQVRQMSKSGRSKQGRKTYKLTTTGVDVVRAMLAPEERETTA